MTVNRLLDEVCGLFSLLVIFMLTGKILTYFELTLKYHNTERLKVLVWIK